MPLVKHKKTDCCCQISSKRFVVIFIVQKEVMHVWIEGDFENLIKKNLIILGTHPNMIDFIPDSKI